MDRKKYMQEVYSHYWQNAREKLYAALSYDSNLIELITKSINPKTVLEVAIGTGIPFADYFQKNGCKVYGIDIAPLLVEKCKSNNPHIIVRLEDAEELEFEKNTFDLVYCFHSTWYFPNLDKAIIEMIRVAKKSGLIFFDIQNIHNSDIAISHQKRIKRKNSKAYYVMHKIKYIVKYLKGIKESWNYTIHEVPADVNAINELLNGFEYTIFGRDRSDNLIPLTKNDDVNIYQRLIYRIKK